MRKGTAVMTNTWGAEIEADAFCNTMPWVVDVVLTIQDSSASCD